MELLDTSLFRDISPEIINRIIDNVTIKTYNQKQLIITEELREDNETQSHSLYIVKSGTVIISKINMNGEEVSIDLKNSGDCFGIVSLIDNKPRTIRAAALRRTEIWVISPSFLKNYLLNINQFTLNLLKEFAKYVRGANSFYSYSASGGAQKKLVFHLLKIGEFSLNNQKSLIYPHLTHTIISSFAGLSRETVTREIKKLKKLLILKVNKNRHLELDIRSAEELLDK